MPEQLTIVANVYRDEYLTPAGIMYLHAKTNKLKYWVDRYGRSCINYKGKTYRFDKWDVTKPGKVLVSLKCTE